MSKATFDPRLFNRSGNTPFSTVLEHSMARRKVLRGGLGLASATMLGGMLSACGSGDDSAAVASDTVVANQPTAGTGLTLGFESIPGSLTDACVVPSGYTAQVLALGARHQPGLAVVETKALLDGDGACQGLDPGRPFPRHGLFPAVGRDLDDLLFATCLYENDLQLSTGLTSRIIATGGSSVAGSTDTFHSLPDGAAVFSRAGTDGWAYVSNSESSSSGGVGAIYFCLVEAPHQPGHYVGGLRVEIVAHPVDVRGHHRERVEPELAAIGVAHGLARDLGHCIGQVCGLQFSGQQHILADRLLGMLGVDAGRAQEQQLLAPAPVGRVDDISLDRQIVANEVPAELVIG